MFKTIGLLKRRPGMSVEEFREYYENNHRVIGEKYLKGNAERYARRFLTPYANLLTGEEVEPEFDVLLEVWYADRAAYDAAVEKLTTPEAAKEIAEDEEKLFDRPRNRFFFVEEYESDLTA
jgi:hypothetical protein